MADDTTESNKDVTIVSAIKEKYNQEEINNFCHIYVPVKNPGKKVSDDIVVPALVILDNCNIQSAGDVKELESLCDHVTELDLTGNNITDWKEVFKTVQSIPNLKFLNLTSNSLDNDSLPNSKEVPSVPNVKHLILNKTDASWETISELLEIFPSLTDLHISLNNHDCIMFSEHLKYPSLKILHFNGHCIEKFDDLCCLGNVFTNLEQFVLVNSELNSLETAEENYKLFPNLRCLNISGSKLCSWDDIDRLRKFESLRDVRMKSIPFLQEYKEDVRRKFIVARLPNIKKLNGSSVKTEEREDAERAFVRHYMDKEEKPQRYYELESVYGRLDPLAEVKMHDTSVLNMKVTCEDKEEFMDVNIQQTVRQFKKLLQNFVGLPPSKFKLIHQEMLDGQLLHEWCLNDGRTLSTCNIREGDQFAVVFSNIRNAKVTFC